ncbi:hypothetical protein DICPUDRAFT_84808 [Dictyostelium purpureum]|uniref:Uncharacterized protein n=1 Tax=Dictyostelium purpureum TaxID=5786 RepID=F1A3T2_DICPU|nr:uncharacterized protein DICPUDRAFT_84808 [Dictyostelium purpureum]EGC29145.1 hypothetical protein DICPUDRAFT_84808 [Dictyostelium purpureum]|eukprot:XP_003294326.1 hypothetical protein DICPUDRAFT_84808 [Dictyostelium purpureum]
MDKEDLFWKVFKNKYLLNKILESFSSISLTKSSIYEPLNRIKFVSITQFSFIVHKKLWNILLDKLESNQLLFIDSEPSFIEFLNIFKEKQFFYVIEAFDRYMKRNKISYPTEVLSASIKAFNLLALNYFGKSGFNQVSSKHYSLDQALSTLGIFRALLEMDDDGKSMSLQLKKTILRKVVEQGERGEDVLRFLLDNPKHIIVGDKNSPSEHRILLFYFGKLKSLDLKYRVLELDFISECSLSFFQHYHLTNSLALDPSPENIIFNIHLFYKLVKLEQVPQGTQDIIKSIQESNDSDFKSEKAEELVRTMRFDSVPIVKTRNKNAVFRDQTICIKVNNFYSCHNFVVRPCVDHYAVSLFTNSLSECDIEKIKAYDEMDQKYQLVVDYIESSINEESSDSGSEEGNDEDIFDEDIFDEEEEVKETSLEVLYGSHIFFGSKPLERARELINYLNETGYKSFTDGLFKVFVIQLVSEYVSKEALEKLKIDFSYFQEATTQLLLLYAAYHDLAIVEYIVSNPTFNYDSVKVDESIVEKIVKSQKFDYLMYSLDSEFTHSKVKSNDIISIIKLLCSCTPPEYHKSLKSLFNHLYRVLLSTPDVSYQQLAYIRNLFKSDSIEIKEDHFTTFNYLYIRSNKFSKYLVCHPYCHLILDELGLNYYNASKNYNQFLFFDIKHVLNPLEFPFDEIFNGRFNENNFKSIFLKLRTSFIKQSIKYQIPKTSFYEEEKEYLLCISRMDILLEITKEIGSVKFIIDENFCRSISPDELDYLLENIKINSDMSRILYNFYQREKRFDLIANNNFNNFKNDNNNNNK